MIEKIAYHYHPETKIFAGTSYADPSPMQPNEWLLPAHATFQEPPQVTAGKRPRWTGSSWTLVAFPDVADVNASDLATAVRAHRDLLLRQADIEIFKAEDLGTDTLSLRQYRNALRDIPQQSGFPESVEWPAMPTDD